MNPFMVSGCGVRSYVPYENMCESKNKQETLRFHTTVPSDYVGHHSKVNKAWKNNISSLDNNVNFQIPINEVYD